MLVFYLRCQGCGDLIIGSSSSAFYDSFTVSFAHRPESTISPILFLDGNPSILVCRARRNVSAVSGVAIGEVGPFGLADSCLLSTDN
jgi:hypothetical protein